MVCGATGGDAQTPVTVTVSEKPIRSIVPADVLGGGIDGAEAGVTRRVFRADVIQQMRSLGMRRLTYRLRTELGVETWHWNPTGEWSDPARKQGYWTSDPTLGTPGGPIRVSWGYRLPRRGSTVDQANDDGYSRLDDGDRRTFWKSNPYLDRHFTGEPNEKHPQWIVVDLGKDRPVNAIRLDWSVPFATRYRVDYCRVVGPARQNFIADTFETNARWLPFPLGEVSQETGRTVTLRLAPAPITARYVRVWMTESSGTAPKGSRDVRDALGYALREIGVGLLDSRGIFRDAVRHAPKAAKQSTVYTSSTDPWHRASDRDNNTEQPGLDTVARSGLGNGLPILLPAGILYDTPENAANLLRYVRARHIPADQMELGEEPDGQYITPEDYGALYARWAKALHAVDPTIHLGGPSFQTATDGWVHWPNAANDRSWMHRFLRCLKERGQEKDFSFFSFEWYPFDDLTPKAEVRLRQNVTMLTETLERLRAEGVPDSIPWYITEYGWSAFATRQMVDLPGALLNAEIVARFLTLGGSCAYLYGYEPNTLIYEPVVPGATWGNLTAFLADDEGNIRDTLPAAYGARMVSGLWMQADAPTRPHALYSTRTDNDGVAAYVLKRPDGLWSALLVNRDGEKMHPVRLPFPPPYTVWQYGSAQYTWQDKGAKGHPFRSLPPARRTEPGPVVTLPPTSLTVIQSSLP